jgi:hypothetical protein
VLIALCTSFEQSESCNINTLKGRVFLLPKFIPQMVDAAGFLRFEEGKKWKTIMSLKNYI